MKTIQLSNFDPNLQPGTGLPKRIINISVDEVTGVVTLHYSDDTSKDLPTLLPGSIRNIVSGEIVGNDLRFICDDATVYTIAGINDSHNTTYPATSGLGLLTDSITGKHKPLVSTDPAITVTASDTQVEIDVNLGAGAGATDKAFSPYNTTVITNVISGSAGIVRVSGDAEAFKRRPFNTIDANPAGVSLTNDVFTLQPGNYYLECTGTASKTGLSYLAVRKVSDQSILLTGPAVQANASVATVCELGICGSLNITEQTELEIVQWCTLGSVGGLVEVDLIPFFDNTAVVSTLILTKTSDTPLTPPAAPTAPTQPPIVTSLQSMVQSYSDRTPTEKKKFYEIAPDGFTCSIAHNSKVYLFGGASKAICIWDTTDDSVRYLSPEQFTADAYVTGVLVGDVIYLIPYSSSSVCKFNTVTESVEFESYGISLTGTKKWASAVHCTNTNKIFALPEAAADYLIIDVTGQTAVRSNLGVSLGSSTAKFKSCEYVSGKVYGIPYGQDSVAVIDTDLETATLETYGLTLTDSTKWWGSVYLPTAQKIVGIPYASTDILVIDVVAGTAERTALGGSFLGSTKAKSAIGVTAAEVIYAFPFTDTQAMRIDIAGATATKVDLSHSFPNLSLFNDAVQVGNVLYCANYRVYDYLLKVDLLTLLADKVPHGRILVDYTTTGAFGGIQRGGNNVAYTVPSVLDESYAIDLDNDRIARIVSPNKFKPQASSTYRGGTTSLSGDVYFAPHVSSQLCRIVVPTPGQGMERLLVSRKQTPVVPVLTSASDGGYVVTSSGDVTGRESYKVFDGVEGVLSSSWKSTTIVKTAWLQIQLPTAKIVDAFRILNGSGDFIRRARLLGSNDGGVTWGVLGNINIQNSTSWALSPKVFTKQQVAYDLYRLEISKSSTDAVSIGGLFLLENDASSEDLYELLTDCTEDDTINQSISASSTLTNSYGVSNVTREQQPTTTLHAWASANVAGPHYMYFNFREPQRVVSVAAIAASADTPNRLVLEGTNDEQTYVQLMDETFDPKNRAYCDLGEWFFENANAYKAYRLTVYAASGNGVRLGKLSLRTPDRYDASNWWGRWEVLDWIDPLELSGTSRFWGMATDPQSGKIYGIPYMATYLVVLDPSEEEAIVTTYNQPALVGTSKYIDGAFSPYDNMLYCIPCAASEPILVIDPTNERYLKGLLSTEMGRVYGHSGATLSADGNICAAMASSSAPLIIDAELKAAYCNSLPTIPGGTRHRAISLGPNGKLYGIPYAANEYTEIDLTTGQYNYIPLMDTTSSQSAMGSILMSNGNIIMGKSYSSGTFDLKGCFYVLDFGDGITVPSDVINHPSVR